MPEEAVSGPVRNRLHASLHAEHFEEAAMFYERRLQWLEDPKLILDDLAELEGRQQAHIDALAIGAPQTLALAEEAVTGGEPERLYVGLRLGCRAAGPEILDHLIARLDGEDADPELEAAAAAALEIELPTSWRDAVAAALEQPRCGPILALAAGLRQLAVAPELLAVVKQRAGQIDPRFLRGLAELEFTPALQQLRGLLGRAKDPRVWSELAIACLRLGDRDVAQLVASSAQVCDWSPIAAATVFDLPTAWLSERFDRAPSPALLTALALRGDPASLPLLVDALADEELAELAAGALLTITGALLLDEPEAEPGDDPDDEDFSSGATAALSHDRELWSAWIREHAGDWPAGGRFRLGRPRDAATCVQALSTLAVPLSLRAAIRDELAIRDGVLVAPVTAPAEAQLRRLMDLAEADATGGQPC